MYFDSLQWMDPVSQLLMQRMMIEFGNDRIFLIATCRTGEEKNVRGMLLALQERNMIVSLPLNCLLYTSFFTFFVWVQRFSPSLDFTSFLASS